jgi:hypothetical protein
MNPTQIYEQNRIHKLIDEILKKEVLNKNTPYEINDLKLAIEYNKKQFLLSKLT